MSDLKLGIRDSLAIVEHVAERFPEKRRQEWMDDAQEEPWSIAKFDQT